MRFFFSVFKEEVCENDICRYFEVLKERKIFLIFLGFIFLFVLLWKLIFCLI